MNISGSGRRKPRLRRAPSLYYSSNRVSSSEKHFSWPIFWFVFKLTAPVLAIVYLLYISPVFKLKEVIVSGNEYVSREDIVASIPVRANVLSLKTATLEADIKSRLPGVKDIKIYKGIPNALKVVIEEHRGIAVWQSGINYYLISQSGIVFRDITNEITSYGSYPRISDGRSLPVAISSRVVSSNFVSFIESFYNNLKTEANLEPDYFSIDETTVDVNLYTKNLIIVKLDSLRSADKQLNDLKLVLLDKKPEIKEYIDLRVNGWAYYK